ncbi:MAG: hypothetical protein EA353_05005 [Puniceicoccaceae bacterium]|nr:MAG: hypothetical protein EA353_05005 [Puniceicoccaceae bacterium]
MTDAVLPDRRFSKGFWGIIVLIFTVTFLALIVAAFRGPERYEIADDTLSILLSEAAQEAIDVIRNEHLNPALDRVFEPVFAGIPAYADFHYSVLGEYTELLHSVRRQASSGILEKMFSDFETRLQIEMAGLDRALESAFAAALEKRLDDLRASLENPNIDFGPLTAAAIADAQGRFIVTLPVGLIATAAVTSGAAKAASAVMANKLAAKIAAKSAAKMAGKLGTSLAGAGAGALVCSWAGPGAVLCGAVAGGVTWFTVDAVIISIDSYFNRPDFENDLAEMVEEFKIEISDQAMSALQGKAAALDTSTATLRAQGALRP